MIGFIRKLFSPFHVDKSEVKPLLSLAIVFIVIFFAYLIANFFLIRSMTLDGIKKNLIGRASSLVNDFEYINGSWNTDKYLSDLSSFTEGPLYIFSIDGFLMDRMNIIHGFLDTSNYDYASSFITPKTIISPINEHWRVFSYPIVRDNQKKGIMLLAYFEPNGLSDKTIDDLLTLTAKSLDDKIIFSGDNVDITAIHQNEIDPSVFLEIVDPFNRNLLSKGGAPAYIDKSYLQDLIKNGNFQNVEDKTTQARFLIHTERIIADGKTVGVVVIGKGLKDMEQMLENQTYLSFIAGVLAVIALTLASLYIYRHDIAGIIKEKMSELSISTTVVIEKITFDVANSRIVINDINEVDIPRDSYQYDICKLLFKNSKKQYDVLDLSDVIGELDEQKNAKRLVYDAVEAINGRLKKLTGQRLIAHQDKKYFLNPEIASKLP